MSSAPSVQIRADAELQARLAPLLPDETEPSTAELDAALARVIWSRLAEPGDAVAGQLVAALGASAAVDLVASGAGARHICDAAGDTTEVTLDARRVAAGLKRWLPRLDRAATLEDLVRGAESAMMLIAPGSALWPVQLDDLGDHAPLLLWVRGNPQRLSDRGLAVVGARACTGYGAHVTAELAEAACSAGASIVSGAAYGIDAVAHRTALASEASTVAVVAGGADRPYPAAHTQLLQQISTVGAICSEMVPGSAPTRWRFLMRNRVIAALATATLVTEAGMRSGSLNTAGHTAELGRSLGAVPGPVTSAASSGCHRLVREYGAELITNGEQVRELLGVDRLTADELDEPRATADTGGERRSPTHRRVIDALPLRGARTAEEVARLAGLAPDEARAALAELELLGAVARRETPGELGTGWVLLRRE
ncbi:MAG: DNA-processing protein DprA [Leucobacter sp.]